MTKKTNMDYYNQTGSARIITTKKDYYDQNGHGQEDQEYQEDQI